MTADFKLGHTRPTTLALLPPHATLVQQEALATGSFVNEPIALEDAAAQAIVRVFEDLGYTVKQLTVGELQQDPDLQQMVRRVDERYDAERPRIVEKPRHVKYKRYGVGKESRELVSGLEVDGLIVARIRGVYTKGGWMLAALADVDGEQDLLRVDLTTIAGNTGRVEAYFYCSNTLLKTKILLDNPEKAMTKAYGLCLDKYPEEGEVLALKPDEAKLVGGDEEERLGEEGDSEEDLITELEALLAEEDVQEDRDEQDQ